MVLVIVLFINNKKIVTIEIESGIVKSHLDREGVGAHWSHLNH